MVANDALPIELALFLSVKEAVFTFPSEMVSLGFIGHVTAPVLSLILHIFWVECLWGSNFVIHILSTLLPLVVISGKLHVYHWLGCVSMYCSIQNKSEPHHCKWCNAICHGSSSDPIAVVVASHRVHMKLCGSVASIADISFKQDCKHTVHI